MGLYDRMRKLIEGLDKAIWWTGKKGMVLGCVVR